MEQDKTSRGIMKRILHEVWDLIVFTWTLFDSAFYFQFRPSYVFVKWPISHVGVYVRLQCEERINGESRYWIEERDDIMLPEEAILTTFMTKDEARTHQVLNA